MNVSLDFITQSLVWYHYQVRYVRTRTWESLEKAFPKGFRELVELAGAPLKITDYQVAAEEKWYMYFEYVPKAVIIKINYYPTNDRPKSCGLLIFPHSNTMHASCGWRKLINIYKNKESRPVSAELPKQFIIKCLAERHGRH